MKSDLLVDLPAPPKSKTGWPWTEASKSLPERMPDGSPWPKISIVTPSFNQAQYLEETIRSVLLQNYPNLEYIIIDGGSTDGSVDIINKYEPWLAYWVSEEDRGQTYAIQKGMNKTTGQLINWLNSDDTLLKSALRALSISYISSGLENAVFCGNSKRINHVGKVLSVSKVHFVNRTNRLLPQSPPLSGGIQASWFLTKTAWQQVSGVDVSLNYTMDTDLYYRCYEKGSRFVIINKELAGYRQHDETKTHDGWQESIKFKKNFYYTKVENINEEERRDYKKRIDKLMFGYCMTSIYPSDSFILRVNKIIRAILFFPHCLLEPHRMKRMLHLLLGV